jgi:DNA polymerase-1
MMKMQDVLDEQRRRTKMIMQVHDELVFEVPEDEVEWVRTEIPRLMAGIAELRAPLLAEIGIGENWEKAH